MPHSHAAITVALATGNPDDRALVAALLSQSPDIVFRTIEVPVDDGTAADALHGQDYDVWLLGHASTVSRAGLLQEAIATGRPVLVLIDAADAGLEDLLFAAGASDCLAKSSLDASLLRKSIRRAIDHARQIRALTEAETALRQSEARYRSLILNATSGIVRTKADGTVVEANPAFAAMLGQDSEAELVNGSLFSYFRDAAERDRLFDAWRAGARVAPAEVEWARQDGLTIWVRLSGRAIRAGDGTVEGFELVAEDVTEHRLLESQFRQLQKMDAIGRLAGGVAHDFNNLLTAMLGYAAMLGEEMGADHPCRRYADEIHELAERGGALTRQLLTFGRKHVARPQIVDLNRIVTGFEPLLRRLIGEHIELRALLPKDLGAVRADPGQVEQVIMNLAINARDAMPNGGRLTIETANVELADTYTCTHAGVTPGPYVMLAVTDTGTGMTPEVRSRLFEPFFTTKDQGSGFGLAIVYGIVRAGGGTIWVYSEPGLGSTFKVYLPRVEQDGTAVQTRATGAELPRGSETILLAEDEPVVRDLAQQLLEQQGYRVLAASHGKEALRVAEAYEGDIDLVLTDIVMPGMNGREMVRHLLWTRPKIRILYMSGYADHTVLRDEVDRAWTSFLQKPFTPDGLANAVRRALDAGRSTEG
jgi:PAS domain S-box-containing protein